MLKKGEFAITAALIWTFRGSMFSNTFMKTVGSSIGEMVNHTLCQNMLSDDEDTAYVSKIVAFDPVFLQSNDTQTILSI